MRSIRIETIESKREKRGKAVFENATPATEVSQTGVDCPWYPLDIQTCLVGLFMVRTRARMRVDGTSDTLPAEKPLTKLKHPSSKGFSRGLHPRGLIEIALVGEPTVLPLRPVTRSGMMRIVYTRSLVSEKLRTITEATSITCAMCVIWSDQCNITIMKMSVMTLTHRTRVRMPFVRARSEILRSGCAHRSTQQCLERLW